MTIRITREVAGWLQTNPGGFRGETEGQVWQTAYEAFCEARRIKDGSMAPIDDFMRAVEVCGYRIETRLDHSTQKNYPMLALPHRHTGF